MIRILIITGFLLVLIAATVVRVVALWPQGSLPEPLPRPLADMAAISDRLAVQHQGELLELLATRVSESDHHYEALLLHGLLLFQGGYIPEALRQIELLTRSAPRFELAQLVYGDLLLARFAPLQAVGGGVSAVADQQHEQRLAELRSEARARLHGYLSRLNDQQIPRALIALGNRQTMLW